MTMKYAPRYYQQDSHDAAINYIKKNTAPCLLSLGTGAGKSVIAAMIAATIAKMAPQKKILCIAPSRELVEQNAEKYRSTGAACSVYCASAGSKCLKEQVIFASPQSLVKIADNVARLGVSAIVIDEAHGITNTMKSIITTITNFEINGLKLNKNCRVIGMTATPYRTGEGYIYAIDATQEAERVLGFVEAKDPYFHKLLYNITVPELIEKGFLTPITTDYDHETYDTSGLQIERGKFTPDSIRLTFEEDESKTALITSEVIEKSKDRQGVIIFASTIAHAKQILHLLRAAGESAEIITGEAEFKAMRPRSIELFKNRVIKFLVNVDILTTGFDAPHVDLVVIMRATESAGLLQQMIGRGLRKAPGKKDCLLLDFAENIDRHRLQLNLFSPEIKAKADNKEGEVIQFTCPNCNALLESKRRNDPKFEGMQYDEFGYFLIPGTADRLTTAVKDPTKKDEFGNLEIIELPMPAHFMRRCPNPEFYKSMGKPYPCGHRFSLKICEHCGADNDIAARQCAKCKAPLVDVNDKLTIKAGKVARVKNDFVNCSGMAAKKYKSRVTGRHSIQITFETDVGMVYAYVSNKMHWILKPIADASGVDYGLICENYDSAYLLTAAPKRVKIKKDLGKICVTGVSYEME